jgi:hypothetical protein
MKSTIEEAIDVCIDAINNAGTGDHATVLKVINEVAAQPYQGKALGIGSRGFRGSRTSWSNMYKRFEGSTKIDGALSWENALLYLYDSIGADEESILTSSQRINDHIIFNHVIEHIISNCAAKNEISKALDYIAYFRVTKIFKEEDNKDDGYLILLNHFASKGDAENFFKYYKLADPGKNKWKAREAKEFLVESFAEKNTIEASLELCRHKNLGEKFIYNALMAFAKQGNYQEAKTIFETYPEIRQPESETELQILTTAYYEAKQKKKPVEDVFDELYERALQVDRKLLFGDFKLRDNILFNLGLANLEHPDRVKKCKKEIKNNSIKKELG